MRNLAPCFSSQSTEWGTPKDLFDRLNAEFGPFDLDAAASEYNHKCPAYYDKNTDALSVEKWNGKRIWLNPPYGRDLGKWVAKAEEQAHIYGKRVVLLLPARTDTKWWHKYVQDDAEKVRFIKGRLKFEGAKSSAPFPSVIVVFDGTEWCERCNETRRIIRHCDGCDEDMCEWCHLDHTDEWGARCG